MEDTDDRRHMFGLVVQESEKDLAELEAALKDTDRGAMRETVHRMMPVWELLGAGDMLSAYRRILHDGTAGDGTVREHTLKIMEHIRKLIDEANERLERNDCETDDTCGGGQPGSQQHA